MSNRKGRAHQRGLERARSRRQQQHRRERRRRRLVTGTVAMLALVGVIALVASLLPRPGSPTIDDPLAATPSPTESTPAAGGVACGGEVPAAAGEEKPTFDRPPDMQLAEGADYRAVIATSCGEVVVDLFEDRAPTTVNSFVFLARQDFFDGLTFHRLEPGFVIQGGDPQGTGAGGPGYEFADELDAAREHGYPRGTLAMANSGPDTNGSQFFIVLGADAGLPPQYSVFGTVVEGDDVLTLLNDVPVRPMANPQFHEPTQTVYIEDVTIEESDATATPGATP